MLNQGTSNILMRNYRRTTESELEKHSQAQSRKPPFDGTRSDALQEHKIMPQTKLHKGNKTLYNGYTCDRSDLTNNFKVHLKRHVNEKTFLRCITYRPSTSMKISSTLNFVITNLAKKLVWDYI